MASPDAHQRYRSVIGHFATGVAVITGHGRDGPVGLTANALCSLSLEPLLLLVCFENSSRTLPVVRETRRFGVNVLRREHDRLSAVFASKIAEPEKFRDVPHRLQRGVPVLDDALAWLACDLRELHPGGDHTIGIGAVTEMEHDPNSSPLIWYRGNYTTIAADAGAGTPAPPGADLL